MRVVNIGNIKVALSRYQVNKKDIKKNFLVKRIFATNGSDKIEGRIMKYARTLPGTLIIFD